MSTQEFVSSDVDGRKATVTIDRPDQLNALNTAINNALYDAFELLADKDITVIVLQSTGDRAFVAGADLKEVDGMSHREFVEYQKNARKTNDRIASHPAIVIAAVDGLAYGGGFELALAADLIVATPDAEFAVPEASLGLISGGGATQRLPLLSAQTKQRNCSQQAIRSNQRWPHHSVLSTVSSKNIDEEVDNLLDDITENAPLAVQEAKRVVDEDMEASIETGLSYEQEVTFTLYETDDTTKLINAFVEKRNPEFSGE